MNLSPLTPLSPESSESPAPSAPSAPRSHAFPRPTDPDYRDYVRNGRRHSWVVTALLLSQVAIALEALLHICASSFFDPMPDLATALAYGLVVATLWFNEKALAKQPPRFVQRLGQKRATAIAIAATTVSLLVAGMAAFMFLPMLPFGVLLLVTVVGLLLLVPFLDTILLVIQLRTLLAVWRDNHAAMPDAAFRTGTRRVAVGTAIISAAAVFWLMARPALIGQYTAQALRSPDNSHTQKRAFGVLRFLHGEGTLLDLAYRRNPPYWVCLGYNAVRSGFWPWNGYNWNGGGFGNFYEESGKARRTYYLLTGTPFESQPRPTSLIRQGGMFGGPDDVAIEETGGYVVGRPVPDLSLAQSEMSAIADPKAETAEYEWTMTFRNGSSQPQEARADILLPHGGVGHAVSLWINGVEQQAKFGSPQKVRAAYQEIAVVQRRDPLLVTMPAPDHLLAQCFPVPAHGEMKIKIGITAPLRWDTNEKQKPQLMVDWPAFGPVNFEVPSRLSYGVMLQPDRLIGEVTGPSKTLDDLFAPKPTPISSEMSVPKSGDILAPGVVRAADPLAAPTQPVDLIFVLDASEGTNESLKALKGWTKAGSGSNLQEFIRIAPTGSRVRLLDTAHLDKDSGWIDRNITLKEAENLTDQWPGTFKGGTDPAPALAHALRAARLESKNPSAVVFLHAASPINVSDLSDVRKELQASPDSGPALVGVQLAPRSQDAVMMDLAGFDRVYARRALPENSNGIANAVRFACHAAVSGAVTSATSAFQPLGGHTPAIGGIFLDATAAAEKPIDNVRTAYARLAQATQTTAGWYESNTLAPDPSLDLRISAGRPAAKARLVTPLSSAVVLETKEQYKKAGLDDDDDETEKDAKPKADTAAPEPGSLILLGVGLAAAAGAWRRRKRT